jgi:hypothetical protein
MGVAARAAVADTAAAVVTAESGALVEPSAWIEDCD